MAGNRPYDNSEALDREGIPDLETPLNQDEGLVPPGDRPVAADEFGVTAREERADEPLAERVTREQRELGPDDIDLRDAERDYDDQRGPAGRLLERGSEDVDAVDDEKDAVASLVAEDEGAYSAEEAAMHLTDSP